MKKGLCPAAKAVSSFPELLYQDAANLQRKWDALTLSAERGGVGLAFTAEQAREAVRTVPQLLGYSVEMYTKCWTMLTATENGLGLSPEEARKCILRSPQIIRHDHTKVVLCVALLKSLGCPDALAIVLAQPRVLKYKEETVKTLVDWWRNTGLDHVKMITIQPTLLGFSKTTELQAKLDLFGCVASMPKDELNSFGPLFLYS